jgi:amidohydrolase
MNWTVWPTRAFGRVVEYRREFHAHPELGYGENETARRVPRRFAPVGIETREGVGGTGVVGLITGAKPGKCVGLRADMDALPVAENTGLPFSSQNPGVCHACGHDLHMAMLLGCAEVLQAMKNELSGSVKLIFQPAEECCPAGGRSRDDRGGVLENPHVDAMFAQHVWPGQTTASPACATASSWPKPTPLSSSCAAAPATAPSLKMASTPL